jgi:hypothetical protein
MLLVLAVPFFGVWAWALGVTGDYAGTHDRNALRHVGPYPPIIELK